MSGFTRRFAARALGTGALAAWSLASTRRARAQEVLGDSAIKGAGLTFVYPVLAQWSQEYRRWLSRGGVPPRTRASRIRRRTRRWTTNFNFTSYLSEVSPSGS